MWKHLKHLAFALVMRRALFVVAVMAMFLVGSAIAAAAFNPGGFPPPPV